MRLAIICKWTKYACQLTSWTILSCDYPCKRIYQAKCKDFLEYIVIYSQDKSIYLSDFVFKLPRTIPLYPLIGNVRCLGMSCKCNRKAYACLNTCWRLGNWPSVYRCPSKRGTACLTRAAVAPSETGVTLDNIAKDHSRTETWCKVRPSLRSITCAVTTGKSFLGRTWHFAKLCSTLQMSYIKWTALFHKFYFY